jgi:uroporphyrinogen decarboxylase
MNQFSMREKVIDAINHKRNGTLPWQIDLTSRFAEKVRRERGVEDSAAFFGNHLYWEKYKKNRKLDNGEEIDIFGVTWGHPDDGGDVGIITDHPMKEDSFSGYSFPEVHKEFAKSQCEKLMADTSGRFRMFALTMNYFERAWSLRGMEKCLVDIIWNPSFSEKLFNRILEHHMELLETVIDYEFEGIYFGDDWGQQQGLIMGPDLWRKYIKPGMKKMFEFIKSKGKYMVLHSCGDIREVLPDLIDMGLDVYNTIQPEIYDLERLVTEYGKDLAFYGAISTQQFLPYATPKEVYGKTREVISILGRYGGYIVAPTHTVTHDIPVENVEALVQAAKER